MHSRIDDIGDRRQQYWIHKIRTTTKIPQIKANIYTNARFLWYFAAVEKKLWKDETIIFCRRKIIMNQKKKLSKKPKHWNECGPKWARQRKIRLKMKKRKGKKPNIMSRVGQRKRITLECSKEIFNIREISDDCHAKFLYNGLLWICMHV